MFRPSYLLVRKIFHITLMSVRQDKQDLIHSRANVLNLLRRSRDDKLEIRASHKGQNSLNTLIVHVVECLIHHNETDRIAANAAAVQLHEACRHRDVERCLRLPARFLPCDL